MLHRGSDGVHKGPWMVMQNVWPLDGRGWVREMVLLCSRLLWPSFAALSLVWLALVCLKQFSA